MQVGEIKDVSSVRDYVNHLENAMTVARELREDQSYSDYRPNLDFVLHKLERIKSETLQGKLMNDIAGMTKFAGEWPVARGRLAMAIWEAEKYFSDQMLRKVLIEDQ